MTLMNILKQGFDEAEVLELRRRYQATGYVHIPGFFDSFLAAHFRSLIDSIHISEFYKAQIGQEYVATDYSFSPELIKEYNVLINQQRYIDFLQAVTGADPIGCMQGHVYVSDNTQKRGYGFHSDDDGNRHFLVSINISEKPFEGAIFSLRETATKKNIFHLQNNDPGGFLLCRIGSDIEHAISDVTGPAKRIVLLSWAFKEPSLKKFHHFE